MNLTKKIARTIVFPTIINLGLEKNWRNRSQNSILNIMYHGVVKKDSNYFFSRHINAKLFEQHLKYLSKNFEILSINEAFDLYRNNIKPKQKSITVSFDDGYKNNLDIALPLLEKYNIKTTFFISSICVDKDNTEAPILWTDYIACLKYFFKNEIISIEDKKFKNYFEIKSNVSLLDFIKKQEVINRDLMVNDLVAKYNLKDKLRELPSEIWELMNVNQLQKLSNSKIVEIGSHGHMHYNLGNIDIDDAYLDMEKSKKILENVINKNIDMIAYPDGSYNDLVKKKAFQIGFKNQLAVDYLYEGDTNDEKILNRHGVSGTTTFSSSMFFVNKAFTAKGF